MANNVVMQHYFIVILYFLLLKINYLHFFIWNYQNKALHL